MYMYVYTKSKDVYDLKAWFIIHVTNTFNFCIFFDRKTR